MRIPWKLKSSAFSLIDFFSAPSFLYLLQKNVTKRSRVTSLTIEEDWRRHKNSLKKYNAGQFVFEFGAGKNLAQNLYLSDVAAEQLVIDLNPMLDIGLVESSRKSLAKQYSLRSNDTIRSISDLNKYGITYRSPCDASHTGLENESMDACVSTNTLEHIPREGIINIFEELQRILKQDGIVSAKIDFTDHYAHTDSSISLLNYLRFSESEWGKFNHRCHYQNRMRHYEYIELFDACGFRVKEEEVCYEAKGIPQIVSELYINKPEAWAATSAYIVLMKKELTPGAGGADDGGIEAARENASIRGGKRGGGRASMSEVET